MLFKKAINRLSKFFGERWKQLLAISLAISVPACLVFAGQKTCWEIIMYTFLEMGVFFLIAAMMGKWGKWLCHLTFFIAVIDFGLSLGTYLASGQEVTLDTIYLMMGTNTNEVSEFFSFYLSPIKLLIWLIAMTLLVLLYFSKRPRLHISPKTSQIGTAVFLASAFLCLLFLRHNTFDWATKTAPVKYMLILRDYEPLGKVAELRHDIPLNEVTAEHPQHIVIIIGESFSKSHSSVYGYHHDTNPELSKLAEEGHLYVFTQCTAPAPLTHLAFKNIFTLWESKRPKATGKSEDIIEGLKKIIMPWKKEKDNWYDYPTFFDIFSQKYTIRWISNQNPHGVYDNVQAAFAALSDTVWYSGLHPEAGSRYDHVVIPVIKSFINRDSIPSITIVNLMGQHEAFFQRYPPSWEYFKPENYGEYPLHQRKRLAQYDNATRYNDRVVGTIFRLYQDENALVFYFPDHGMDLYETASDYCGHANPRNPKSFDFSCQIPFFIYATERYRQAFPQQIEQIEHSLNKPFNTKDLIYTLMQITGWELAQDDGKNGHGLLLD